MLLFVDVPWLCMCKAMLNLFHAAVWDVCVHLGGLGLERFDMHMHIYIYCIYIYVESFHWNILANFTSFARCLRVSQFHKQWKQNIQNSPIVPCTFWKIRISEVSSPSKTGERVSRVLIGHLFVAFAPRKGRMLVFCDYLCIPQLRSGNESPQSMLDWLIDWRHLMIGWWWKMVDSSWWMMGQMGQNRLCFGKAVKCVSGNSEKRNVERNVSFLSMVLRKDR